MTQILRSTIRELSDKVIIATTTLYNTNLESDKIRAQLAVSTIRRAADLGYKIIVVDGGSPYEMVREFERSGALVHREEAGTMGKGRRQAIRLAYDTKKNIIAWTEPEKEPYITELIRTVKPIIEDSADLVIPCRISLESYPTVQQHTEAAQNLFFKVLTGRSDLELTFGPRTWQRDVSNYFLNYSGDYGDKWDAIHVPVINMLADDKKVVGVNMEYTHPRVQTEIEEWDLEFFLKRFEQLENFRYALKTHWMERHLDKISK